MEYETITKFGWDQANGKVKVYITSGLDGVGKIPKENITCEFEDDKFDLRIQNLNNKNYRLKIAQLQNKIKFGECKFNIKSNGISITLVKDGSDHWTDLKPKQSMFGKEDPKIDENGDPLAGMQNMMKEMYQNGDDKTKAMIAESW